MVSKHEITPSLDSVEVIGLYQLWSMEKERIAQETPSRNVDFGQ